MSLFAIADLHLSLGGQDKPMDVFRGWEGYVEKLSFNWKNNVSINDTVVIPGDVSWAMDIKDAKDDFAFLEQLPGSKIIIKGNHDYWWTTARKMDAFVAANGFQSIRILHNASVSVDNISICGTRGWLLDNTSAEDDKIIAREVNRLQLSLNDAQKSEKIVFLHYPPLYLQHMDTPFSEVLVQNSVKHCYYGHLHGKSIGSAYQGEYKGVDYKLISADALHFCPYKIL